MNDELKQVSYKISSMNPIAKKALAKKISEEIPYDRILLLVDFVRQIHLFAWNERLKEQNKNPRPSGERGSRGPSFLFTTQPK